MNGPVYRAAALGTRHSLVSERCPVLGARCTCPKPSIHNERHFIWLAATVKGALYGNHSEKALCMANGHSERRIMWDSRRAVTGLYKRPPACDTRQEAIFSTRTTHNPYTGCGYAATVKGSIWLAATLKALYMARDEGSPGHRKFDGHVSTSPSRPASKSTT